MHPNILVHQFESRLAGEPGRVLVAGPGRSATAADLGAASRHVAGLLRDRQVPAGACVAIQAPNGPGFLALVLGCLRGGAVPILLDHQTPAAEAGRVMAALGARRLVRGLAAWPDGPDGFSLEEHGAGREARLDRPAVIKLSSGSTGAPRGIETPLPALLADESALAATMGIGESDRLLAAVPMAHSYGLSSLAVPALVRGTTLLLPEPGNPFSPLQVAADMAATVFPTTPAWLESLLGWQGDLPPLPGLRRLISAGAPLRPETARRIRELWGRPVHTFYGASECGGIAYDRAGGAAEEGLVGEPVRGVEIGIEPQADRGDGAGRVVVRSPAVARGYLPERDPRLQGGRYVTDDLGVLADGRLRLQGRLGPVIKIRGKKVHPGEVQEILAGMPGVREAHVQAVPGGAGEARALVALVVPDRPDLSRRTVMEWCRRHLAPEKVPRRITLVPELPRTERGKIDLRRVAGLQA